MNTKTIPEPDKTASDLWFDYRCHSQYPAIWDRAEENVALIMQRELNGTLPNDDDARMAASFVARSGSPSYWMQFVDMPSWFSRDHLGGRGSMDNYWKTQHRFPEENRKRERAYLDRIAQLEKARKVLSRTYRT